MEAGTNPGIQFPEIPSKCTKLRTDNGISSRFPIQVAGCLQQMSAIGQAIRAEAVLCKGRYLNPNSSRMKSLTPSGPLRLSHTASFCGGQRISNPKNGQHFRSSSIHSAN